MITVNIDGFYFTHDEYRQMDGLGIDLTDSRNIEAINNKDMRLLEAMKKYLLSLNEIQSIDIAENHFSTWMSNFHKGDADLQMLIDSPFASEGLKTTARQELQREYPSSWILNSRDQVPGFVYLLHDELNHSSHYKIGLSRNVEKRVKSLAPAKVVHTFPSDNMGVAEAKLHHLFASQRLEGEWFHLYSPNVEYIKSITEYKTGEFSLRDEKGINV